MNHIKYHFALNEDSELVDIENVSINYRSLHTFYCICCGAKMTAKLGKKNRHHFAHHIETSSCSSETYLHKLAKITLKQKFESSPQFNIVINRPYICSLHNQCPLFDESRCLDSTQEIIDLKQYYNSCSIEQPIKNFVADILLQNNEYSQQRPPLVIEIRVSHKCTDAKIQSGIKIIEIPITSEEDIELIIKNPISETYLSDPKKHRYNESYKIHYYGFEITPIYKHLNNRTFPRFYLYPSGRASINRINCQDLGVKKKAYSITEYDFIYKDPLPQLLTYYGYVIALNQFENLKVCPLCKYCSPNPYMFIDNNGPLFCHLHKKYATDKYPKADKATNCKYYRLDTDKVQLLQQELQSTTIIEAIDTLNSE